MPAVPAELEPRYGGAVLFDPLELILSLAIPGFSRTTVDILIAFGDPGMFMLQLSPYFAWVSGTVTDGWGATFEYEGYGGGLAPGFRVAPLTDQGVDGLWFALRFPLGYISASADCASGSCMAVYDGFNAGGLVDIGYSWIWSGFILSLGAGVGFGYLSNYGVLLDWEAKLTIGYAWPG